MRLLALDASTTAVGWCVFEDGEYQESGVFVLKGKDWRRRIYGIQQWLSQLLTKTEFDVVAYEIATGDTGNMHTHRCLGAVQWACWCVIDEQAIWCEEVTASQVRASSCHKHALPNARAISGKALDGRYAGDEADAIGVALAALAELRKESLT